MRASLILPVLLLLSGANGLPAAEPHSRPNILLLSVDSFRPDRIGCYGDSSARTPNLDRFASGAVLFTNAFSTAAWTNASMVSLLTGLYPGAHGIQRRGQSVSEGLATAIEALKAAGYFTPEINYLFPMPNYKNLGFTPNPQRNLVQFLTENRDSTFFAWYHFHGPHLPYSPPQKYLDLFLPGLKIDSPAVREVRENIILPKGERKFSAEEKQVVRSLYDAEVAAQDEELGEVFDTLEKLGLYENSIVVVTADHGEELFERGWLGHASTSLHGHLHDELIQIPLIVRLPGRTSAGRRVEALVQSVDLMPTLFELAGLPPYAPVQGKSLLGLIEGEKTEIRGDVYCESSACGFQCPDSVPVTWLRCVRERDWKLTQTTDPGAGPCYELYDLVHDRGENRNLYESLPEEAARLKGVLAARIFANT
ncbi:MAG TPA: sulfatase, partial [Candidatus Glassbacteria bacterium]|nr:sulfatase [Candidatus Glassbacteria bacterium]